MGKAILVCEENPDAYIAHCLAVLKRSEARITKPRINVITCLAHAERPLTPREIFEQLSKKKAATSLDQVSVYRVLETLQELNLVHQVFPGGGFFPCIHQSCGASVHVLTYCRSCELTTELHVPEDMTSSLLWYLKSQNEFQAEDHLFQVNGTCKACQKPA